MAKAFAWFSLAGVLAFFLLSTVYQRAVAAPAPTSRLWVEYLAAPGDSVRYEAHWTAPTVGPDQRPLVGYDVQIVLNGQTVLSSLRATQPQAIITIARPAPGDSLGPIRLQVRSVDSSGAVSAWAVTPSWTLRHAALPPTPPATVTVDSGTVALDSVVILPRVVAMQIGTTLHLCPVLFPKGGTPGLTAEDAARDDCYGYWQSSGLALR